jgi:hypothetical protein
MIHFGTASAQHRMTSVGGFLLVETASILVQYDLVSPLIAVVYARGRA